MKNLRLFVSILAAVLTLFVCAVVSNAATSGTTGTCKWEVSNNTLSITASTSGSTGKMADYTTGSQAPWYSNNSSIKNIVVDDSVTYIGNYAFADLTYVTKVHIGAKVESIGSLAFKGCSKLATVDYYASKCNVAGGSTGTRIFNGTAITTVNFGDDVKYLPPYLFLNCTTLESISIPESVYYIGEYAFGYCTKLTTVNLPDKLTELPEYMFYNCSVLSNINMPKMLTNIGNYTFYKCSALGDVELPATVTEIGYGAFEECPNAHIHTTRGSYAALFAEQYGIELTAIGGSTGGSSADLKLETKTNVFRNNYAITIAVEFDRELSGGECVHTAFYDANGNVVNYFIAPVYTSMDDMNIVIQQHDIPTATYVKVFIWDSLDTCQPISAPETVPLYPEASEPEFE